MNRRSFFKRLFGAIGAAFVAKNVEPHLTAENKADIALFEATKDELTISLEELKREIGWTEDDTGRWIYTTPHATYTFWTKVGDNNHLHYTITT